MDEMFSTCLAGMEGTKVCRECKLELPTTAFYRTRGTSCKECISKANQQGGPPRRCRACGQTKECSMFPKGKHKCMDCKEETRLVPCLRKILGHTAVRVRLIAERSPGLASPDVDLAHLLLLWKTQMGRCALSGRQMTHTLRSADDRRWNVSLDRIDSTQQYSVSNTQLVCVAVNRAKHDLAEEEFLGLCRDVVTRADPDLKLAGGMTRAASL